MARTAPPLLIRNAQVLDFGQADVRIANGVVEAIEARIEPQAGESAFDADGGLLLPGLHDHHIHLAGLAARRQSVFCGPPEVENSYTLRERLATPGTGWIRAIGYHESVLDGLPTARELDRFVSERPVRMQHRSGRMWLLNSAALDALLASADAPPGLERDAGGYTGRLFDEDDWLRAALGSVPPDFAAVSTELARFGITGLTDMSVHNDAAMAAHFELERDLGALLQRCMLAGRPGLAEARPGDWLLGPVKLHLHEADLPPFEDAVALIETAHGQDRSIAIHCVSEVELVFALAALEAAGSRAGDRIEHASVTPPPLLRQMADMGLSVCTQPHFIAERGDRYLQDVEPRHHGDLYRLKSFLDAGMALAGGSDAPFGDADPWAAMHAAVTRRTSGGQQIGSGEALAPEQALSLYLADPRDLAIQRTLAKGARADLCLLDRPWEEVSRNLGAGHVALTMVSGRVVHDGIDQSPAKGLSR